MNCSVSFFYSFQKLHISSLICLRVYFFSCCLKKVCCPRKRIRRGAYSDACSNARSKLYLRLYSAAYLSTFRLQSLFKETEMLLISFYCFHLILLFSPSLLVSCWRQLPSSFSLTAFPLTPHFLDRKCCCSSTYCLFLNPAVIQFGELHVIVYPKCWVWHCYWYIRDRAP